MGLTDKRAYDEILKLYNLCFDANSLSDRVAYTISVSYNMINFGDWFHHKLAHYFTGDALADGIEAFGELRGDLFFRAIVPEHKEEYSNIVEAMRAFTLKVAEIESQCIKAIKASESYGAESYGDFLREVNLKSITPLLKQGTVFYNQIQAYSDAESLYKWNKDFEAWVIEDFRGDGG